MNCVRPITAINGALSMFAASSRESVCRCNANDSLLDIARGVNSKTFAFAD
jgi:hypothetical protein